MKLLFFNELINSDLAAAVAWTLLHSTWQGMLAAILAGIIVVFFKKQSSSLRYHLFTLVFILFLISVATTFITQYNDQRSAGSAAIHQVQDSITSFDQKNSTSVTVLPGMSALSGLIARGDLLLHQYYPFLFSCWLLVFLCKLFFMLTGFRLMNRLRKESRQLPDIHWQNLVNRLCYSMGIERHVQLLESSRIKVPMMTGFFKPVIFVPLGICCHLPPAELEAILLHELAHVRRSDYLMNLLQRLIETIFFFNPCILWLSSLIREERENCCDDMAVMVTRNKEQYIAALVAFQEYSLTSIRTPAIAFANSRYRLLYRAKRLLINENKKLNHMEKMILVCSMFALTAAFSISAGTLKAQNKPQRDSQHRQETNKNNDQRNDDMEHVSTITSNNNGRRTTTITAVNGYGKKYVLRKTDGRVTRLVIDNKEIDENDYPEYKKIIESIESGSANSNSNQNNNNNIEEYDDDVQREIQLSREAELLARKQRQLEAQRVQQHRTLDGQRRELELRQQKELLRDDNRHLIEERMEQRIAQQREMEVEKAERREMELPEKMTMERKRAQLREMELHQKMATESLNDAQQLLREHQKLEADRLQDQKVARKHYDYLNNERREAQLRMQNEMNQRRKRLNPENNRNQDKRDRIYDSMDEELRDLEQERVARERSLLTERKMALREQELQNQQNKNINRLRSKQPTVNTNNEIQSIVALLTERGIIEDDDNVSFTLNEEKLVVNGKKQPQALHEELKNRFIQEEGDTFIYEKKGNSISTTINRKR